MRFADRQILFAQFDRNVEADGRQPFGQPQVVGPGSDLPALFSGDTVDIRQDILHRTPFADQFAGTLLADPRDARNVVRSIPPQGQNIPHQLRIVDAVLLTDLLAPHDLDTPVGSPLLVDAAAVANQLSVILVGRHHIDVVTRLGALLRKGADHVVGLITLDFEDRDAHRLQHPFHVGNRQQNIFGRLRAIGLVLRKNLPPETPARGIEGNPQQIGAFALLDVAQELHEAEHHRGVHPRPVAHGTPQKGIVILEYQRIGVDQKEFFHSCVLRRFVERGGVRHCLRRTIRRTT